MGKQAVRGSHPNEGHREDAQPLLLGSVRGSKCPSRSFRLLPSLLPLGRSVPSEGGGGTWLLIPAAAPKIWDNNVLPRLCL